MPNIEKINRGKNVKVKTNYLKEAFDLNQTELTNYINYFKCLETDLMHTARYAEPIGQADVYSFEYYKIIMLACSEVETVFKIICKTINENCNPRNITDYAKIVLEKYPNIIKTEVNVSRINSSIKPFESWTVEKCMFWWDEHQDIKHHRHTDFKKATYKNALYSLAGLYVLLLYLMKANNFEIYIGSDYFYNVAERQLFSCVAPGDLPDFTE